MNSSSRGTGHVDAGGERGAALTELALALPLLLLMAMGIIDLGTLIHNRLIITNVSREGGSIASRMSEVDASTVRLLQESARPLALNGALGKVVVSRIKAGTDAAHSAPTVATQVSGGALAVPSGIGAGRANLGLPRTLYDHLVYDEGQDAPDIADVTVVEVFYKYRPLTMLPHTLRLMNDGDGVVVLSRAVF
jgi:hypothetical protein